MSDCFDHMQDAWDDALFGRTSQGAGGEGFAPRPVTCRRCGTGDLWWHNNRLVADKWRDKPVTHVCPPDVDAFPLGVK